MKFRFVKIILFILCLGIFLPNNFSFAQSNDNDLVIGIPIIGPWREFMKADSYWNGFLNALDAGVFTPQELGQIMGWGINWTQGGTDAQITKATNEKLDNSIAQIRATCVPLTVKCQEQISFLEKYKNSTASDIAANRAGQHPPGEIANFVGWILYWIASFFSWLVSILVGVLVTVASYNNFLNHRIVLTGWQIIRDICNNFFIIGLLVISVATILRQPASYQYQQALGKLLVMAVLINFSKLFTGILIDVSQVITIYFANALASQGGQVILYALGLFNLYQAQQGGTDTWDQYGGAVWSLLYALILSVIAAVVVASIIMVLVYRIVALWFLVILSPAAFLAKGIPGQDKYFSEWFGTLSKELIVAPVMLFFLYLSLFAGAIDPSSPSTSTGSPTDSPIPITATQGSNTASALNANLATNTKPAELLDFLLIIGLLVGSLVAGQRVGAKGSSWAGAGIAKLDGWRKKGKAWGIDRAKDAAVGSWSLAKATGRGIDKIAGGKVGGLISLATTKSGAAGGTVGGAVGIGVGAGVGTLLAGPLGGAIGAAAGGAFAGTVGSVLGGASGKALSDRIKRQRAVEQNRYKASIGDGKTDEVLDLKGERFKDLEIERDGDGNIINVVRTDENGNKGAVASNEKINLLNKDKGVYERAKFENGKWVLDVEKQIIPGGEQARDKNGNVINQELVTDSAHLAEYLDANAKPLDIEDKGSAAYKWDGDAGAYVKLEDDAILRKPDGTAESRFAEYESPDGKKYRKIEKDGSYYEFDGSKNDFARDENGKRIIATSAWGDQIKAMSPRGQAFYNGYSSGMNKSYSASSAAEAEKIGKIQKDFDGLPKEQLRQLLDVERDGAKLTAIALTMGLKKAFKETDVLGVSKAKEALQSNSVLLKQFNDEMNKKFAVLNNSKLGKDGKVEINDAELAKMVSAGDMKWADQNVKQMTPEALKIMAKQMGVNFHKELEKMIKTDRDKISIGGALDKNVTSLGFSGEDLSLRKSAGAINGDWIRAFSSTVNNTLQVNQAALTTAIKQIPKPEIFATVNDSNFSNNEFKKAIATSMDVSMLSKMSKNYEVSTEKMRRYADMIKEFAGDAQPNKNGTPEERAAYLVSQAKNNTSNSDLKTYFM